MKELKREREGTTNPNALISKIVIPLLFFIFFKYVSVQNGLIGSRSLSLFFDYAHISNVTNLATYALISL